MKTSALVLTICASAIIILALPCRAAAQAGSVGIVEEIRGTVFWRANANDRPERLDPRYDTARRLYPGEQVRCARGGSLRILLGNRRRIIRPSAWFPIPPIASAQPSRIQRLLDDYATLGGRDRSDPLDVFSPSDHSVAMPDQFTIRWTPGAAGCALSLTIRDVVGNKVWRRENIDASAGSVSAPDSRERLKRYRDRVGAGPLTLQVEGPCGRESQVTFLLLSVKSEQALKQDLAFWGKRATLLLHHLGRASVFSRYGMFPQAAEEYEAALRAAPHSRHLLIRTVVAHRQTGNFLRAMELEKRLPPGTKLQ